MIGDRLDTISALPGCSAGRQCASPKVLPGFGAQRWPRDEAELTLANLKALAPVFMSGLVQSSWRSPLTHTALASAFAWISEIRAIRVIGMTSLGSHRNEVCDPRKLKPEPFHDAASGTKIVEVDGSSSVGGEAARRTIEPPDDFPGIMLSRECDDHRAPSYIRNLLLYSRIFYHRQFTATSHES